MTSTLNLVLDLDNTLIHTFVPKNINLWNKYYLEFQNNENLLTVFYEPSLKGFVFMRPFLIQFLLEAQKYFILHVFSAGTKKYVRIIMNALLSKFPEIKINNKWGSEDLIENQKCIEKYLDIQKTYIIDDLPWIWKQKCFKIEPFKSFEEKNEFQISNLNENIFSLEKKYNDSDEYLLDYLDKVIQIIRLSTKFNNL